MKGIRLLTLWVMTISILAGCWNRVEINDIAIVTAIGLDLVEGDKLRLSLQVAVPSKLGSTGGGQGGSSEKGFIIISETGATISEAYRNIQGKLPRRIFFSQSRVLLIGEDLAKHGVYHIIDFHTRYAEPRINSFIMFTKGKASEIINSMPKFENISAEEMKELAKMNVGLKIYVRDFLNMLLAEGLEPMAPQYTLKPLEVETKNKSEETQALNGIAVFKKDKLVGWMDEVETRGLLWLRNEMETGIITLKVPKEKGGGNISMEIIRAETKIVPILKQGKIIMKVNVVSELSVIENDSQLKLAETKVIEDIQKDINNEVRDRVQMIVDRAQKDYQSDIFGFGQSVYRKYPREWNTTYKNNWDQKFGQLDVKIESKSFIRRIGLIK
nr:Ger(x)C family spore germination protein [Neobacillus sp. Marseille-Q6967]